MVIYVCEKINYILNFYNEAELATGVFCVS